MGEVVHYGDFNYYIIEENAEFYRPGMQLEICLFVLISVDGCTLINTNNKCVARVNKKFTKILHKFS